MRSVLLTGILSILAVASLAAPVLAANPHIVGDVSFVDNGLTLTASAKVAGLGNEDLKISISAVGDPIATCTNPSGKNKPPGQNPAPVAVTGSVSIPASQIENGHVDFSVTTQPPATPIAGAPDCPNTRWTEDITDMQFTSATISVEQPVGSSPVVVAVCTFSPPTSNGPVPSANVACTT